MWVLLFFLLQVNPGSDAGTNVAVASNFTRTARQLAEVFAATTGDRVVLVFGSTGQHYAQIKSGAPFAAFLAADERRPRLLEEQGLAVAGSRFTYAVGRLVLWSSRPSLVDSAGQVLQGAGFRHLAIANPTVAPYGQAAREVLEGLALWDSLQHQMVRGQSVGQAFHMVRMGNAELGFLARSQYESLGPGERGSVWLVPEKLHLPLKQQAVLLTDDPVAEAFLEFLKSPVARGIIQENGYDAPQ